MEVPAPVEEVHEAHAFLDEAAGEEAVVGEAGFAGLGAVGFERRGLLLRDVHDFGHAGLHAESEFVLGDARDRLSVAEFVLLALVQVLERVERGATEVASHARRIVREEDRVSLAAALHALEDRRDEAGAPAALAAARLHAVGDHRHEAREVLVLGAESIGSPRAQRRTALAVVTGEEQEFSRRVIELVRVHRLHERDLVGDLLEVRDGVAHPESALAVLLEGARGAHELRHAGGKCKGAALEE